MANTTNLDLVKPLGTDHALISVINGNMDKIDAYAGRVDSTVDDTQQGIAIVSDGDTHAAIAAGQFVYIRNHNTLNEGMYTANSAIAADASLTSSNVTALTSGAANKLKSDVDSLSDQIGTKIITPTNIHSSLGSSPTIVVMMTGNVMYIQFDITPTDNIAYSSPLFKIGNFTMSRSVFGVYAARNRTENKLIDDCFYISKDDDTLRNNFALTSGIRYQYCSTYVLPI